uniref:Uncharacterized protein n=1 Tax=viral metagenome TaxID=1070528 RepID=A0A6M3M957_9ZZZZ
MLSIDNDVKISTVANTATFKIFNGFTTVTYVVSTHGDALVISGAWKGRKTIEQNASLAVYPKTEDKIEVTVI